VTNVQVAGRPGGRRRPEQAIDARRRAVVAKVVAVEKAVKTLGRVGAPITRTGVAQLANVSRSFTYENETARTVIATAQAKTQARATDHSETRTAQHEASWRERALNAEEQIRHLRHELTTQRRLVGDLMGQLRQPDGTWVEDDRIRLRADNEHLLAERNRLASARNDLQRRLDAARANVAHLHSQRVTDLFPDGPGK